MLQNIASEHFHAKLKYTKNVLTFTILYDHELKFHSKKKTEKHSQDKTAA